MAKSKNPRKLTKKHQFNENMFSQNHEKQHSWVVVRNLFTCKYVQVQQQQHKEQQNQEHQDGHKEKRQEQKQKLKQKPQEQPLPPPTPPEESHQKCKKIKQPKEQQPPTPNQIKRNQEPPMAEESNQKCKKMKEPIQEPPPPPPEESNQKSKKFKQAKSEQALEEMNKKSKKMKCSGSLCSNTKIMQRPELSSPTETQKKRSLMASSSSEIDGSNRSTRTTLSELNGTGFSSSSSSLSVSCASPSISGSFRGMPFRKLSGCYECRMVVDPILAMTRDPSLRATISSCPECGEIFTKAENLELHQAVRHAVSELGPEDTSKNIVEIIFQSSWLKKQTPVCKIDRILKVQNTPKTISRFEEYRDSIKAKATRLNKKHPRCIADGNELLRFHCTTFMCSLGLNGSSNLCNSIPSCNVCSIIKNGFKVNAEAVTGFLQKGILTTATSGKAHDRARVGSDNGRRAMLVCRVIAGRVKKNMEGSMEEYDSLAGVAGTYPNLDELYVFNPKAILPCFVVIYSGF
ncbi:unnamed protein product [Fraxinus pennsylvanica]|uniref:C2H2-type domain-containing protein n=1 Tax=Fraxinus pennsylvanica TaxID=56036 RepID=A0AAD1ZYH0_9LAMI|nr:unnamed protein product [Fraxinus pennsylvanica]